jgi:hypothetical protein
MHDSQLEEQLRGVLRAEGDAIPLTITTADLERRLAARRRTTGGRRLSWVAAAVAAAVVVSIVAAGNGWLKLPAIGTVSSPSPSTSAAPTTPRSAAPSFKPVPGVGRIEPPEGSTVLREVLPTTFAGVDTGEFNAGLPLDQYVVTVQVHCVGTSLTLTEGSHEWPITCDPEPTADAFPVGIDVPVADGNLALRWTADPNVGYTILVTKSAMPASLPALEPFDATTVTIIDAASSFDRPLTAAAGTRVTQSVGILPDATDYAINLVCLGPGEMPYALGQPGRGDFVMSSTITCDGKPKNESFSNGAGPLGPHEVYITTDSRTAWHARIGVSGSVPSARPTSPPLAARSPLGRPDEAILVRPIGASSTTPDSLEVTRFDPTDQTSVVIATIPGTVVPPGKWLSAPDKLMVSATGWLAIPFRPGPDATDTESGVVFVDLLHPSAAPNSVVGISSGSWSSDDTFAAINEGGVQLYYPATNDLGTSQIKDPAVHVATSRSYNNDPIWTTAANSRFIGRRDTGEWGVISVDGSFSTATDLPPTYQRTGVERPAGAGAHTLKQICTGDGNALEAGCTMVEIDATGQEIATRVNTPDYAYLLDFAWADDGREAWLLFGNGPGGIGDGTASLTLSQPSGSREARARIGAPAGEDARILGLRADDPGTQVGFVVVGDTEGFVSAFIPDPGGSSGVEPRTFWFAGWAGPQPDYDPD